VHKYSRRKKGKREDEKRKKSRRNQTPPDGRCGNKQTDKMWESERSAYR
jgi:hypothetical protein